MVRRERLEPIGPEHDDVLGPTVEEHHLGDVGHVEQRARQTSLAQERGDGEPDEDPGSGLVEHLAQATLAFALALAFMSVGGILGAISSPAQFIIGGIFWIIPAAPAFIIHEIAHKVTARKYGCWAEFRASPSGLRFGVFLAALTSIVFMAPGAVMVAGNTSRSQFGKIALAGPVSNIMLWALGIVLIVLGLETTEFTSLINGKERGLLELWCWVNVGLGTFNMLPFGPLDGKKIKTWSDSIYWIWAIVFVALIWFNINILPNLL